MISQEDVGQQTLHQIKDLGKWLHQTYIDSLSLIMLGLDHVKNLQEKRPQG